MAKRFKILIASILAGSGHNSGGDLLAETLKNNPNFEIVRFVHPSKSVDNIYNEMTKDSAIIHNFFVKHSPSMAADISILSFIHLVDQCLEVIDKEQPDLIISTHYILSMWFKIAQLVRKKQFIMMNAILDYGEPPTALMPYNIFIRADFTIVYAKESKDSVITKTKQRPANVLLAGHRPLNSFLKVNEDSSLTKEKARDLISKKYKDPVFSQISQKKITILIASGGGGTIQKTMGFLKKISLYQRRNISLIDKYQYLLICGQNEKFRTKVLKMRRTKLSWQNIFPLNWLKPSEYAIVQKASDFPVLYGIAPATMHELMYNKTLPIVVHKLRAEQERGNVNFIVREKLGYYIKKDSELILDIYNNKFIRDREKFQKRSEYLLNIEEQRLNSLPEKIEEILAKKKPSVYKIYEVSFTKKMISNIFTFILVFVYYLRKTIYKILGPLNFWEKREKTI
jgi:UDP-N-acetylglucosamine:LPS N-acetylglucosamine transferase